MRTYAPLLLASLCLILSPNVVWCEEAEKRAKDLVQFLTVKPEGPTAIYRQMGLFSCGLVAPELEAADALVALGQRAIPVIEGRLEELENVGSGDRYGLGTLEIAYSKILGSRAFARIRDTRSREVDISRRRSLDEAWAYALGVDSFVSDSTSPLPRIRCRGGHAFKDTLDRMAAAWFQSDPVNFIQIVMPSVQKVLFEELRPRSWQEMRASILGTPAEKRWEFGYQFLTTRDLGGKNNPLGTKRVEMDTLLVDRIGKSCGRLTLVFEEERDQGYRIANTDLGHVLKAISACAKD